MPRGFVLSGRPDPALSSLFCSVKDGIFCLGDRRIALTGMYSDRGKVDEAEVAARTIAFGPNGLLFALNSRAGEVKEGAEVMATVAEDVALPALGQSTKPEEAPALKAHPQ